MYILPKNQIKADTIILGAGASGLMLGAFLKTSAVFVDSNKTIGAKIKISGGAKCNITNKNITPFNYLGDVNFIKNALNNFTCKKTISFLSKHNIFPHVKTKGQYFCNSSEDVLNMFLHVNKQHKFILNTKIENCSFKDNKFILKSSNTVFTCKKLVVASGGISFPSLGASDIGYKIAKYFKHAVTTLNPALVGLTLQKEYFWMKELSGISIKVNITCENYKYTDNLLFSHRGISGPAILSTSLRWSKGSVVIDFIPDIKLSMNHQIWSSKKQITTLTKLPKRFIKAFLNSIDILDKPLKNYTNEEKIKIISLKNYIIYPAGTFGFSKAEVTKGGVETNDIDSLTFMSKKQKNLFFIGEVLDVTGELGGYNIQWAFSSGVSCAQYLNTEF